MNKFIELIVLLGKLDYSAQMSDYHWPHKQVQCNPPNGFKMGIMLDQSNIKIMDELNHE